MSGVQIFGPKKVKISRGRQKSAPMLIGRFTDNGPPWTGWACGQESVTQAQGAFGADESGRINKGECLDDREGFLGRPTLNPALWISAGPIRGATRCVVMKFPYGTVGGSRM